MTVLLNEPALSALLESPVGPVGRMVALRAEEVAAVARENASGSVIGIRSRDLIDGIHASGVVIGGLGLHATVSTPARHRGFAYPTFHDQTGRPWLSSALQHVFEAARVVAGV